MNKIKINLFNNKEDCCDCNACKSICPKDAIYLYLDEYGFEYPKIDREKCIECGLCKKVCAFQNIDEINTPIQTYVGVSKDKSVLNKSASGGIFTSIAKSYLEEDGVVFGVAFDEQFTPIHIGVNNSKDLYKLQGSKYVQSIIGNTYKEVKILLDNGKKVLYSGTPCQIAGLKGYLMRDYSNLLTIDIICHGVPSFKFFKDYLNILQEKLKGKIIEFNFRDKKVGWGKNGSVKYEIKGKVKEKIIYESESSYYYYFSNSDSFRESCYNCKYTCKNRPGDITIGDYWGIEIYHPELLKKGKIQEETGVSVVIANTKKGKIEIDRCNKFNKYLSDFSKAKIKNSQLNSPSKRGTNYERLRNEYKNNGYMFVDKLYNRKIGMKRYKSRIKASIPNNIKRILKKYI